MLNASFATPSALQSSLTLVTLAPGVNSSAVAAAGANSSALLRTPATNATFGSRVYLLLNLRTAANRSILQPANVQVNVTGEDRTCCGPGNFNHISCSQRTGLSSNHPGLTCVLNTKNVGQSPSVLMAAAQLTAVRPSAYLAGPTSGQLALPPLARTSDGQWITWFTARRPEVLTASLRISGQLVRSMQLQVLGPGAGINPFYLDFNASMASAALTAQNLGVVSPMASGGALLLYANDSSVVRVPVMDRASQG